MPENRLPELRTIGVDFNQTNREPVLIGRGNLTVRKRHWFLFFLRLSKRVDITYHRLWVEVLGLPPGLRLREGKPLAMLDVPQLDQKRVPELQNFQVRAHDLPYEIVLDTGSILDVTDDTLSSAEVTLRVGGRRSERSKEQTQDFKIRFDFVRARSEPRETVVVHPPFDKGYEHGNELTARLGTLVIENSAPVRYAHPLDVVAFVPGETPPLPSCVYFGEVTVGAGHPAAATVGPDGQLQVRGLAARDHVEVPLLIDLTKVRVPEDVEEFTTEIKLHHQVDGREFPSTAKVRYQIRRNRQKASLLVTLVENGESRTLASRSEEHLAESIQWSAETRQRSRECFTLRIGNPAMLGRGSVQVRDLALKFEHGPELRWNEGAGFRVNDRPAGALEREHDFPDRAVWHRDFTVSFRHTDLTLAEDDDVATVRCLVTFQYRELEDTAHTAQWHGYSAQVVFKVERNLGAEWLAVDFGTSAVVVAKGTDGRTAEMINLQEPLRRVLAANYTPEEVPEYGTRFLSSAVVLVGTKALEAPSSAESVVYLAPPRRDLTTAPFPIPYVKALVGTGELPDVTGGDLKRLEYRRKPGAEPRTFAADPMMTEELLRETYARLLADHVEPALNGAQVRKVVFTVPNSFTPRHLQQLRKLVAAQFPRKFKDEYIAFVSESDAVACFYVGNPGVNRRRQEAMRSGAVPPDEHVLVYDMGAGTLDLTYLRIRWSEGGTGEVLIIGRMGRSTAGNYLDTLIAREVAEQYGSRFGYPMFGKDWADPETPAARHWLKRLVQTEIKPALNQDGTITLRSNEYLTNGNEVVVDVGALRNSPRVTRFIRESTSGILENFFALFPPNPGQPHLRGTVPIDTVILSGRSMQLKQLREAVVKELVDWSGNTAIDVVGGDDLGGAERLKSVVVQGAIQFAAVYRRHAGDTMRFVNRNVQARYGLLYLDPSPGQADRWAFKELLNPSTLPLSPTPVVRDGIMIFEYDTDVHDAEGGSGPNFVNLSQTAVAYFVQSFSADTAGDANADRWEYITRMAKFAREQVGGRPDRVHAQIIVDRDNLMTFILGAEKDDPVAPLRMNLDESPTFKEAMWPFLPGVDE